MGNYEKPKRGQQGEESFHLIVKHFYWRLFLHLMTPAVILAVLLWLPVIILNNQPDRTHAQCSVYHGEYGVRIISQTRHGMTKFYYWTDNHGDSWQLIHSQDYPYQLANADCDTVSFLDDNAAQILDDEMDTQISPSGKITVQAVVQ